MVDASGGSLLHNDKINKLLELLKEANGDLELDDQLRTRVFRGRFSRRVDPLHGDLDSYLDTKDHDDNKENVAPEPSKKRKDSSVRRPSKKNKSAIPVLQALPNAGNTANSTKATSSSEKGRNLRLPLIYPLQPLQIDGFPTLQMRAPATLAGSRSPHRICIPKSSRIVKPQQLVLRPLTKLDIYLVDSLTGLVNDATQFGTELNASNCEGFPMPEDVNEIVQIPTNETVGPSEQQKMALIKAYHSTRMGSLGDSSYRGFYSKKEFDEYVRLGKTQVKVYEEKRRVRWADDLEW